MYNNLAIDTKPELKKNVLNFRDRVTFKYEGMLSHSFDRFYVVTKFEMPKIKHLKLATFSFDLTCKHLNNPMSYIHCYLKHCQKIAPYVEVYQKQIEYYNHTAYEILKKEKGLILPTYGRRNKRFIGAILGGIASSVIGLAFEGISTFLHHKRHKALTKVVNVMKEKVDSQCNSVYHLKDTMITYGKYNSDTLMDLIHTVHHMQNITTWKEKMFVGKMTDWVKKELAKSKNEFAYSVDTILFLTAVREKYVKMYERFIVELKSNSKAIRTLSKGYLPISLIPPSKLEAILVQVKVALTKTNKDYDLVINRLYLYYNMKLVMFGIDNQKNLIIQSPVFVQTYTQTRLTLDQIETVPMLILDANDKAQSYTQLKIEKPYIAVNEETYISLCPQELNMCKRIGYEHFCEELFVVKSKHKYSCASMVYFNLEHEIKQTCEFNFHFNQTNVMPSVLGGGHQLFLQTGPAIKE